MYAAKVIEDSIADGVRLTTLEVTFPRFILAEFNTHRMFSRNSASSRAIPVAKRIAMVEQDPFVPEQFGRNQKGMQAGDALEGEADALARASWLRVQAVCLEEARVLASIDVHKEIANRVLELFSWTTVVVSATEWENFFNLRISKLAQPQMRATAAVMYDAMLSSRPTPRGSREWHLPYVQSDEREAHDPNYLAMISAARCARVSYLTHDGRRDMDADIELAHRLESSRHMSPFEHPARVIDYEENGVFGNFSAPWRQQRKYMSGERVAPKETP